LTDPRKKLKSSYGIKLKLDDASKSVEQRVEDFLPKVTRKDSEFLTAGVLRILFDTTDGSIHAKGNVAAHIATQASKLYAISDRKLPGELRTDLLKLYQYAYHG